MNSWRNAKLGDRVTTTREVLRYFEEDVDGIPIAQGTTGTVTMATDKFTQGFMVAVDFAGQSGVVCFHETAHDPSILTIEGE